MFTFFLFITLFLILLGFYCYFLFFAKKLSEAQSLILAIPIPTNSATSTLVTKIDLYNKQKIVKTGNSEQQPLNGAYQMTQTQTSTKTTTPTTQTSSKFNNKTKTPTTTKTNSPPPTEHLYDKKIINEGLEKTRIEISEKIKHSLDTKRAISGSYSPLYELLSDYPFRNGKMLRPTLCISMTQAVGGMAHSALSTAAALELYHNAFLILDDIEDGSETRRGKDTLHQMIGVPRAINVGNATQVLAVTLLLENLPIIGISKTMSILHEIEFMAIQSVEGQAMELDWVATNAANLTDQDYLKMCVKKTCWYTFITPCRLGLIVGYPSAKTEELSEPLAQITRFGMLLGIAFQIQDDLLNLEGTLESYGKEIAGDIYEGKRTLMLNHVITHSSKYSKILEILAIPREQKTPEQVAFILDEMRGYGSIDHGWQVATNLANQAANLFDSLEFIQSETPLQTSEQSVSSVHNRRFLKELINFIIYRNK